MSDDGAMTPSFILGLTGSIGMGKSTTASMFSAHNIPVHDSDAVVHGLYRPGGELVPHVAAMCASALRSDGSVDRSTLRDFALHDPAKLAALEAMAHPIVKDRERAFLDVHRSAPLVLLDMPLLFETGAQSRCDAVLVVTAPVDVQRSRVLARDGMTETILASILARQWSDLSKREQADFVIDTNLGRCHVEEEVSKIIATLHSRRTRMANLGNDA